MDLYANHKMQQKYTYTHMDLLEVFRETRTKEKAQIKIFQSRLHLKCLFYTFRL